MTQAFRLGIVALTLAIAAVAIHGILDPRAPFGFFNDIGSDAITADYLHATISSPADLRDVLGFFVWYDEPSFVNSAMATYLVSVPLVAATHDPWRAIKIVGALQIAVAVLGGALFARGELPDDRQRPFWSWACGWLYALAPQAALAIRGSVDIGWIVAVLPLVLAVGRGALARYGPWTLPGLALLADLGGIAFHVEYAILVSLPLFAIFTTTALLDVGRRAVAPALVGIAVLAMAPAYFVLPTFASRALLIDAPTRTVELNSGAVLPLFSEGWLALLALIQQENLLSPRPAFNASSDVLWYALVGVPSLLCALVYVVRRARRRPFVLAASVVGLVCFALSLGTTWPGGIPLWSLLAHLPVANALRTPDRFATIPFALASLFGVIGAASLARRLHATATIGLVVCAALAVLATLDVRADLFGVEPFADHEPDLALVGRVVHGIGGKTVSVAFARYGSIFDTPAYGVPQPSVGVAWDVIARYLPRSEGAALLARTGVRSLVESPNWLAEGEQTVDDLPALIARSSELRPVLRTPAGLRIFTTPRPARTIESRRLACLVGGPGLFDLALDGPGEDRPAYVGGRHPGCTSTTFADASPSDVADDGAVATWYGDEIVGAPQADPTTSLAQSLTVSSRRFLNDAWYRDAIDGDATASGSNAIPTMARATSTTLVFTLAHAGTYDFAMHVAPRTAARLTLLLDGRVVGERLVGEADGLAWIALPLRGVRAGKHRLELDVSPGAIAEPLDLGIDTATIRPFASSPPLAPVGEVLLSSDHLVDRDATPASTIYLPNDTNRLVARDALAEEREDPTLVTTARVATATYRLSASGPRDAVVLSASARLGSPGSSIEIGTSDGGRERCCVAFAAWSERTGGDVTLVGRTALATGARFFVRLRTPQGSRIVRSRLTSVESAPAGQPLPSSFTEEGLERIKIPLGDPALAIALARSSEGYAAALRGADRGDDATLSYAFRSHAEAPATVTARVDLVDSPDGARRTGSMTIRCGEASDTEPLALVTSAVIRALDSACELRIRLAPGARLASIGITVASDRVTLRLGGAYVPAGRYDVALVARDGHAPLGGSVKIDGRSAFLGVTGDGVHEIDVASVPSVPFVLRLRRIDTRPPTPVHVDWTQRSAVRWRLSTPSAATIELADLDDGRWRAVSGSRTIDGYRCDLLDTCFDLPAAGSYEVVHAAPPALVRGSALSSLAVAIAISSCAGAMAARRRPRRTEVTS